MVPKRVLELILQDVLRDSLELWDDDAASTVGMISNKELARRLLRPLARRLSKPQAEALLPDGQETIPRRLWENTETPPKAEQDVVETRGRPSKKKEVEKALALVTYKSDQGTFVRHSKFAPVVESLVAEKKVSSSVVYEVLQEQKIRLPRRYTDLSILCEQWRQMVLQATTTETNNPRLENGALTDDDLTQNKDLVCREAEAWQKMGGVDRKVLESLQTHRKLVASQQESFRELRQTAANLVVEDASSIAMRDHRGDSRSFFCPTVVHVYGLYDEVRRAFHLLLLEPGAPKDGRSTAEATVALLKKVHGDSGGDLHCWSDSSRPSIGNGYFVGSF